MTETTHRWLRTCAGALLAALPLAAAASPLAEPAAWNPERVAELAGALISQAQELRTTLEAAEAQAKAAVEDPDREVGGGPRMLVLADLAILETRAQSFRRSVAGGQGREQTRSLFGRIESLVGLTATDVRGLPDFASYEGSLGRLEQTVGELGRFYAEDLEVTTPPDPLKR